MLNGLFPIFSIQGQADRFVLRKFCSREKNMLGKISESPHELNPLNPHGRMYAHLDESFKRFQRCGAHQKYIAYEY
jgi:hypothetical protein